MFDWAFHGSIMLVQATPRTPQTSTTNPTVCGSIMSGSMERDVLLPFLLRDLIVSLSGTTGTTVHVTLDHRTPDHWRIKANVCDSISTGTTDSVWDPRRLPAQ